jgi:hypothetical protein
LDYGPLLQLLKGKKWVLEPHCIEVAGQAAKVNLFEVPGGWVIPVTFGPKEGNVTVILRNIAGITGSLKAEAIYPGSSMPVEVPIARTGSEIRLTVGMLRGCAMVRIVKRDA